MAIFYYKLVENRLNVTCKCISSHVEYQYYSLGTVSGAAFTKGTRICDVNYINELQIFSLKEFVRIFLDF